MNPILPPTLLTDAAAHVAHWFRQAAEPGCKEILGHLTVDIVRDWIRQTAAGTEATKCAVLLDAKRATVTAFLLTDAHDDVYSARGARLLNVFSAVRMDDRMRALFATSDLAFIPLSR